VVVVVRLQVGEVVRFRPVVGHEEDVVGQTTG
jgi:hypothetical protein